MKKIISNFIILVCILLVSIETGFGETGYQIFNNRLIDYIKHLSENKVKNSFGEYDLKNHVDSDLLSLIKEAEKTYHELRILENQAKKKKIELSNGYLLSPYNIPKEMLFLTRSVVKKPQIKIIKKITNTNSSTMIIELDIFNPGDGKIQVDSKMKADMYLHNVKGNWILSEIIFRDPTNVKRFWTLTGSLKFQIIPGNRKFVNLWKKEISERGQKSLFFK